MSDEANRGNEIGLFDIAFVLAGSWIVPVTVPLLAAVSTFSGSTVFFAPKHQGRGTIRLSVEEGTP